MSPINNIPAVLDESDERQTDKFDYKVEQVPFHLPDGTRTRFLANVRTDNNEVLGCVTERYEVCQNSYLFEKSEDLFKSKGFSNFTRKAVVSKGGARARAIYDFPELGARVAGQDLTFRLKVQNSFDGSLRASFLTGMFRLICSNGLAIPVNAIGMTRKHTSSLDMEFVSRGFDSALKTFQDAVPVLSAMSDTALTTPQGITVLDNLVKRKVMTDRQKEGIESVWSNPTYHEDRQRNLWNLYNAATQDLTHRVEGKRFELAERVNSGILQAFTKAMRNGNGIQDLLVKLN
mgnify:CR=1 FL=1